MPPGIEPGTQGFSVLCSTNWAMAPFCLLFVSALALFLVCECKGSNFYNTSQAFCKKNCENLEFSLFPWKITGFCPYFSTPPYHIVQRISISNTKLINHNTRQIRPARRKRRLKVIMSCSSLSMSHFLRDYIWSESYRAYATLNINEDVDKW